MSIKSLLDQIGKVNIADDLTPEQLVTIGNRVKRQFDEDWASMTDWMNAVTNGIELMRQEYSGKSFPWDNASNYKDPILTEAATVFGDKASLELLRAKDLVSAAVIGRDKDGKKKEVCERISEVMNYQINYDMDGWREDQERLLYCLPVVGSVFKKVVFDPLEKECESVVINFPDFAINQATRSMEKCRSFSHILPDISENDIEVRVRCGKWLDPRPQAIDGYDKQGDKGSNEQQGVIDSADNAGKYVEQHTFFDLDEDGYEEPYLITFRVSDGKVVRILARYDERSIIVGYGKKGDMQYLPIQDVLEMEKESEIQQYGGEQMLATLNLPPPEIDPNKYELIKVEPFVSVVKYGFITAPDNTFLDLGYSHLLGALTQNINSLTNQINDRTTLNILGGGFLAKEFRAKQGMMRFRMGEYKQTEVPAEKLAKGIFPQPLQEPSAVGVQLLMGLQERAKNFLSTVDISGKLQANTAPTTALAIIQEAIIPTTALFKRVLSATSREFQILFRINQRTFPADKYKKILDDPKADPQADFNFDTMDIIPTANAEMSSKMHRIQTAQLELEQLPNVMQTGGNGAYILKNFFDAIGSDVEKIFPEDGAMSDQEKQMQQQMLKAQQDQAAAAQQTAELLKREQDRLDKETGIKEAKAPHEIQKLDAETQETLAKAQSEGATQPVDPADQAAKQLESDMKVQQFNNEAKVTADKHELELRLMLIAVRKAEAEAKLAEAKVQNELHSHAMAVDKHEHAKAMAEAPKD